MEGQEYRTSDTSQLINILKLSEEKKKELCDNLPFYDSRVTFASEIFSHKYNIVVLSVVDDYIRGLYQSKDTPDLFVGYAGYFDQEEWLRKFNDYQLFYLLDNFNFVGKEPIDVFESNLRQLADRLSESLFIVINGPDIDVSEYIGRDRINRNIEMNRVVDRVIMDYANMRLLDMREVVRKKSDVLKDNRHFNRNIYCN